MGCLNSNQTFSHWFGNIHLSGPCNRSCYFCIGQHMMALDSENTLDSWPLPGIGLFLDKCTERGVRDIFVTGTNTDPLLYKHSSRLTSLIKSFIPQVKIGVRTNAAALHHYEQLSPYHMGSVTVCSFDPGIYRKMMGSGDPPNLRAIAACAELAGWEDPPKLNVVLGPENNSWRDLCNTINTAMAAGVTRINLREPYGQPRVGNPFGKLDPCHVVHGMPCYKFGSVLVTYWDVHYCEVESVNLYANGRVSEDYPITRGHSEDGKVLDQSNFIHGRQVEQWVTLRKKNAV